MNSFIAFMFGLIVGHYVLNDIKSWFKKVEDGEV